MQVSVSGKQVEIGESLTNHVIERLKSVVEKYFENAIHAEVVFSRPSHKHEKKFRSDIMVEGAGFGFVKSNYSCDSAYTAFDQALEKMAHRLSKYKNKIKNHTKRKILEDQAFNSSSLKAVKYVLSPFSEDISAQQKPEVVEEKDTQIETLSVSEAIMKMELSDLPALLFRNKETERINVVYHRADGNISWIDPSQLNN